MQFMYGRIMGNKQPEMTTDWRRHPGIFKQVDRLVTASETDAELAYLHRLMALCSLPRTDPGDRFQYERVNGPYTLIMYSSGKTKLPYGPLPRLLMAYVCTEAVQTQSPEVLLGDSLSAFMRQLGMGPVGSSRTRLRNQMDRLFNASVSLIYENKRDKATVNAQIATPHGVLVERAQARREGTVAEQGCSESRVFQRDHQSSRTAGHEHSEGAYAQRAWP